MRKIRAWRFTLLLIISSLCLFFAPFFRMVNPNNQGFVLTYYTKEITDASWALIGITIVYLFVGLMANSIKNKPGKFFGGLNIFLSMAMIINLSFLPFENYDDQTVFRLVTVIPIVSFIIIDTVLALVHISISLAPQTIVQQTINNNTPMEEVGIVPSMNNVGAMDSTQLKAKILQMQNGLSKSYEEAIEEIELTGELSGIDMKGILDEKPEENSLKIEPIKIDLIEETKQLDISKPEIWNNRETNQVNSEPEKFIPRRFQEDPLSGLNLTRNSDYEELSETSLSRNTKKEFDIFSKRDDTNSQNRH